MWWWILFIGFMIASVQSFYYQTFNGLSLFGLIICLVAAGAIFRKEIDQ